MMGQDGYPRPAVVVQDDRLARLERTVRQLRISESPDLWDESEGPAVTPLPPKFQMPDMERYTGQGDPRSHLRLYRHMLTGCGLDESQILALFPRSLTGLAQRWYATIEPSHKRT